MSITVALTIYATLIAVVSSLLTYYFKIIRPQDEEQSK